MIELGLALLVLAVVIGFILWLDRSMTMKNVEMRQSEREEGGEPAQAEPGEKQAEDFSKEGLAQDIARMLRERNQMDRIGEKVYDLCNREIKKKTDELQKRYNHIISEKDKSRQAVTGKYKNILHDKHKTESILRSVAEGLVVVDSEGKVMMMNPTAEGLLGVDTKDKLGKPIAQGLKNSQLLSLFKDVTKGKDGEIEVVSQEDETRKILRSSTAVIENENGQTVGMVSVLSDVTKQRELEKAKTDFLTKVSHELRTPIMTLQNSVSILLEKKLGPLNEEQSKLLSIVQRSLKRLAMLINELLDLSRLKSSRMKLEVSQCSLKDIIEEAHSSLTMWARSKGITMEKSIPEKMPDINTDGNRIIQVINNLVGNSIKFTPHKGRIRIEAGLDTKKENAYVSVSDNGIGIPKEDLDKVFDRFHTTGERVATDMSGTGLGLAIAKEIVHLHGGRIWAEASKGGGAKFTFTMPLAGPASPPSGLKDKAKT